MTLQMGSRSQHVLRDVLGSMPPKKILDAPAGGGQLARFLKDRGWDVHCADIDPGNFGEQGLPFERVDLNRGLPYPDESFDHAVCAAGLHRLFNPGGAIREFHRVLRKGGSLHVTVNNYASITKRLRFLLYGSITNTINESRYAQTIENPEANVRHVLLLPQLGNLLQDAGFRITDLRPAMVSMPHVLLSPLAWLIRLGTLFISSRSGKRNWISHTRSSAVLPGGKYLYVAAVKPAEAPQAAERPKPA